VGCAARGPARLGHEQRGRDQHRGRDDRQHAEDAAPADERQQLGARDRREQRDRRGHDRDAGEEHGQLATVGDIPDDGEHEHRAAGRADALGEPERAERRDRRCHRAADGRQQVRPRREQQRLAPADPVAPGADDELPEAEPDGHARQRQLHRGVGDVEVAPQRGERRQVEVYRQWTECRQEAEHDHRPAARHRRQEEPPTSSHRRKSFTGVRR
jgi:hypothetical protein